MPKSDFNKVALHNSDGCSIHLLNIFRTLLSKNTP